MNRRSMLSACACLLLALAVLPLRATLASEATPPSLIPLPAQFQLQPGRFTVDADTPIVLADHDAATKQTAAYLIDLLARTRGLRLRVAEGGKAARAIVLQRDPQAPF
jgi:hexosaminidase